MASKLLTKSAFKIARSCPTKLYYYRSNYPSTNETNAYLEFLADGGHIVGKLAQLLFQDGILIESADGLDSAVARTTEALKKENVVLFEAALKVGNKLVLVDILEKKGKYIKLIEVKSKAYDSEEADEYAAKGKRSYFLNSKGIVDSEWKEYLEDICFQTYVARLAFPQFEIIPYLCLPDKGKTTSIEGLASMFTLIEDVDPKTNKKSMRVEFRGEADKVRSDHFLVQINVEAEVALLWEEVKNDAERFDQSLSPKLTKIATPVSTNCKGCEYDLPEDEKSGYSECWGKIARVKPHIFDLYHGTTIQKGELFESLISSGKISLFDVPVDALSGKRGIRQSIQIEGSKTNREWISPDLRAIIQSVKYPLHFVDFETSRVAVPYHAGMRPYEQVAFQWSCHTIKEPGGVPVHSEWINTEDIFPNFEFARKLMEQVGEHGSVLTWAHHESSTLDDIAEQLKKYGKDDVELSNWISELTDKETGRIVDLNKVTLDCFFHPSMGGRTSLKYVLPAVWNNHPELRDLPWLKKYVVYDSDQKVLDPYKVLSAIEIAGQAEVVKEGTGAMRAYQDMMFGQTRDDPARKEKWKALLLQYCELDTIAMLVVWEYWQRALGVIKP